MLKKDIKINVELSWDEAVEIIASMGTCIQLMSYSYSLRSHEIAVHKANIEKKMFECIKLTE